MKTGERGLALIKESEGYSAVPYQCTSGVWTIGYGHTKNVTRGSLPINREKAEAYLREDLRDAENAIARNVKVKLTQSQFDALVSLIYNIGEGNFKKSTLLKKLNKGNYDAVPEQILVWNKSAGKTIKGLVARRAREATLWSEDEWEADNTVNDVRGSEISRATPSVINKENISWGAGIIGSVGLAGGGVVSEGAGPIQYAIAVIMVIGFVVGLYYFVKRRGA